MYFFPFFWQIPVFRRDSILKDPQIMHFKAKCTQRILSEYSTINFLINLQYFIVTILTMLVLKAKILRMILDDFGVGIFTVDCWIAKFAVAYIHKAKMTHL